MTPDNDDEWAITGDKSPAAEKAEREEYERLILLPSFDGDVIMVREGYANWEVDKEIEDDGAGREGSSAARARLESLRGFFVDPEDGDMLPWETTVSSWWGIDRD